MIKDLWDKLPLEIIMPLALLVFLVPILKLLSEIWNNSRSHNRENLQQLVDYLEKYLEKKDKITAFAVEEAAQSRYRKSMSIAEIEFFLGKDDAANQLWKYSRTKPHVEIREGKVVLCKPTGKILTVFSATLTWKEFKGYLGYAFWFILGLAPWFVKIQYHSVDSNWMRFLSPFLIILAFSYLNKTESIRAARKYINEIR